ncbi:DUF2961 domain-containing protein [Pontibacter sp. 172403-2]|uniref:glycoside hydrolase family 172 protein n=1 Tax=Pontibacter rufus TaxID=2791028 RepID=UPI0018AFCADC|nr:glycoside hydrolase family 172 protein [Pontibacter sp. 172403-2]MBF9255726.1 DUF2961 domain-containing protein [Pontibacter sp. 172403-2]
MKEIVRISIVCFLLCSSAVNCSADFLKELQRLYRIDLLPRFRGETDVRQLSSYDPSGGNDDGFSGKHSYLRKEGNNLVIADLKGPGVIQRIWTPTPTEDTIQFYFDGESKPRISVKFIDLFTGKVYPFVRPIVGNEVGGYYCYIPIPYQKSCKVVFKGERMQFFQLQYRELDASDNGASFPKALSDQEKEAIAHAAEVWSSYGNNLNQFYAANTSDKIAVDEKTVTVQPGQTANLFKTSKGGRIIGFELTPLTSLESNFKDIILKAKWDGEKVNAINSPVTDFFGYAFGKPAMRSLLVGVRDNIHYSYLPMPFEKSASIDLAYLQRPQQTGEPVLFKVKVFYVQEKRKPDEGKLYVKWRREINPEKGKPYQLLKASGRGHEVGIILQAQGLNPGMTIFFEGDDSTVVDGELRFHGTGSEDLFNGGWYALADRWDQGYSLPVHGALTYSVPLAQTGGYRFYITDKVSFNKSILQTIEHGPEGNKIPVDYTSVAFYYSDAPPKENVAPTAALLEINPPQKLEYWTQLLPISALGFGSSITYENLTDKTSNNTYDIYKLSGRQNGSAKFRLDVPSDGKYKLYLSYFKCPTCGTFQVNQRQNPVSGLINSEAKENILVEKELMGTLNIEKGTNTITVVIKDKLPADAKKDIYIHKIFLEKQQ